MNDLSEKTNKISNFIEKTKRCVNTEHSVIFVVGNESCDLDSAICAISLAYFYNNTTHSLKHLINDEKCLFVPIMNISRLNFPLKTEVVYFLENNGIDVEYLICK